jgi:tetratricopeptide (TPR) repeat protein
MKLIILTLTLLFHSTAYTNTLNRKELFDRSEPRFSKLYRKKMDRVADLLVKKKYDKAISLLDNFISSSSANADNAEFYAQRGRIKAIKGSYHEAEKDLNKALALKVLRPKPTFQILEYLAQIALNKKDTDKSIQYLNQILSLNPEPSPKTLVLKISILAEKKKYQEALILINKVIGMKVTLKEDWMSLFSAVYVMAGTPQKAIPFLKKLLTINPLKNSYWTQLTSVYLSANQPLEALSTLRAAYEMGHLKTEDELSRLADLFSYLKIPFSAAALLEKEFEHFSQNMKIKATEKIFTNYKYAREIDLAEKIINNNLKTFFYIAFHGHKKYLCVYHLVTSKTIFSDFLIC